MHLSNAYDIMIVQSVVLSVYTEVIQMKYENATCEIVLLDNADCLTASPTGTIKDYDTPFIDYPNY